MPTCNDNPGLGGRIGAAPEDVAQDFKRKVVREPGHGQCQERLATHRVDVRHCVGSGDPPIDVRVVNHRGKEIHRLHERAGVINPPY